MPPRPRRSYRALIESLRQVWQIETIVAEEAIWKSGRPEREAFTSERIRLAVWNMCKGAGGLLFEHDYRSLAYRCDLLLVQEALLSERGLRTFGQPGFETIHAASYKRRDGLRDGVMTAARVMASGPVVRVVCKYPEPIFRTPKVALIKSFKIDGAQQTLMVINVHATLMRLKPVAIEEMEHLVSHLPAHDGPMIFAGDFNTFTPGYLKVIADVLGTVGLEYIPIPDDPRPRGQALDWVFARGLDVTRAFVDTTIRNSDHFPVLIDFRYTGS
jgi:endonuclease/exonuclease/phosphatase (EEP) superfamily protein YafD